MTALVSDVSGFTLNNTSIASSPLSAAADSPSRLIISGSPTNFPSNCSTPEKEPSGLVPENIPISDSAIATLLQQLNQFQDANAPPPKQNYFCRPCRKTFISDLALREHCGMFHSEKAFICETCGKAFRFRSNLAEHRSVHTSVKPYVCKYCGKSSRLKGNLTKHILKHHKVETDAIVGKEDIIIKKGKKSVKDPRCIDFLEKSMIVLCTTANETPTSASASNALAVMASHLTHTASPMSNGLLSTISPINVKDEVLSDHSRAHTPPVNGTTATNSGSEQVSEYECAESPMEVMEATDNAVPHNMAKNNTQCYFCGKHFRKASQLELHLQTKHNAMSVGSMVVVPESQQTQTLTSTPTVTTPASPPVRSTAALSNPMSGYKETAETLANLGERVTSIAGCQKDIKEIRDLLGVLKGTMSPNSATTKLGGPSKVEHLLSSLDSRVSRVERQMEASLSTLGTLIQVQTSMNLAMSQFRVEIMQKVAAISESLKATAQATSEL